MTISEGRWVSPFDIEDSTSYSNYLPVEGLTALARESFDIVVVGGGGAGAVAAIDAGVSRS